MLFDQRFWLKASQRVSIVARTSKLLWGHGLRVSAPKAWILADTHHLVLAIPTISSIMDGSSEGCMHGELEAVGNPEPSFKGLKYEVPVPSSPGVAGRRVQPRFCGNCRFRWWLPIQRAKAENKKAMANYSTATRGGAWPATHILPDFTSCASPFE